MTEPTRVAGKLGRLPHDPDRPALKLGPFLTGALSPNPTAIDWLSSVKVWPMYGNDRYGDCVWAEIGHHIEVVTTYGQGANVTVSDAAILKGYSDVTGFDPADPSTDQGTVIADALSYWRKTGVGGHKILAYAKVDHANPAEVEAAINLFGAVMVGVNFPKSAMDQFNAGKPWDVVPHDGGIEGGHAILVGAYQPGEYDGVTWGAREPITDAWWFKYVEECWAVIAPEWINAQGVSPKGIDLHGLGEYFATLTGQANPFPQPAPGPTPGPVPPVADADAALAAVLEPWVKHRHTGENHVVQVEALQWLSAKGFA
jgi:hypothetical protein